MNRSLYISTVAGVALMLVGTTSVCAAASDGLRVQRQGRALELAASLPADVTEVELRIVSSRNRPMSKYSDLAPADPKRTDPPVVAPSDTWYPVVDVELSPAIEAVAKFDKVAGFYAVNGWIYREKMLLQPEIVIPGKKLELWENAIWVEPMTPVLTDFYLRQRVPVSGGALRHTLRLITEDWSGVVSLHAATGTGHGRELMKTEVAQETLATRPIGGRGLERERILASLAATVAFNVRAHHRNPASTFDGGLHEFYDLDARTYRSVHWIWGYSPSVKLLLDAAKIPEIAAQYPPGELVKIANAIGLMTLRFCEKSAIDMLVMSRFERRPEILYGFSEALTPADGLFLAGLAWIPLYEATGDERYLTATKRLAVSIDRICRESNIIPQNFRPATKAWDDFTIEESGFGAEGFAQLHRITRDDRYREMNRLYMGQLIAKLEHPEGLWNRRYVRSTGEVLPPSRITRSMGWVMEGLISSHELDPDGGWLARAKKLGNIFVAAQKPDGHWTFIFDQPAGSPIADKGTPQWSWLLYRAHKASADPRYRDSARKALEWSMNNQYAGPDPEAHGGIVGVTIQSAVGYRPWFRVACIYGSGFFGLATLEELKLQGGQDAK